MSRISGYRQVLVDDREDLALTHDDQFFTFNLDGIAGVLAEQHDVAHFQAGQIDHHLLGDIAGDHAQLDLGADADTLVAEVSEGSKRLSELVTALKSYSYLDQAPVQDVDVAQGIDDTLLILKSKTSDLTVMRGYEPGLPLKVLYLDLKD